MVMRTPYVTNNYDFKTKGSPEACDICLFACLLTYCGLTQQFRIDLDESRTNQDLNALVSSIVCLYTDVIKWHAKTVLTFIFREVSGLPK